MHRDERSSSFPYLRHDNDNDDSTPLYDDMRLQYIYHFSSPYDDA